MHAIGFYPYDAQPGFFLNFKPKLLPYLKSFLTSETLERLVSLQLLLQTMQEGLSTTEQSAFRAHHSTESTSLFFLTYILQRV